MTIYILLTTPATDAGPFNLYSDVDGFVAPFSINVSKATLLGGYSVVVPNGTTIVRIVSVGGCTSQYEFPVYAICPSEDVYMILGNTNLVKFNPDTEVVTYLNNVPDSPDIAMTNDKMFFLGFDGIFYEYDITLNPWSITLNRTIDWQTLGLPFGPGLETVSNTKILVGRFQIFEVDISGVTPVSTQLFEVPDGGSISGDIYYNPYNDVIFITYGLGFFGSPPCFIAKFTRDGQLIASGPLAADKFPYGMYAYNNQLYVINSDGTIYLIDQDTLAYTFQSDITTAADIFGAAQPLSCRNNIIPPFTTTTTTTIDASTFWYYGTYNSPGGVVPIPDENDIDISSGTVVTTVDPSGTLIVPFNSAIDDYLWFAIPVSAGIKSNWFVTTLNQGVIGGPSNYYGNLFPDPVTVTYNSTPMYLYISTGRTNVVQMTIS